MISIFWKIDSTCLNNIVICDAVRRSGGEREGANTRERKQHKVLVRINSKRRIPLYAGNEVSSRQQRRMRQRWRAESQFQSSYLWRARYQGENNKTCRFAVEIAAFVFIARTPPYHSRELFCVVAAICWLAKKFLHVIISLRLDRLKY